MVYYSLRLLLTVFNSVYFSPTPFGGGKRPVPAAGWERRQRGREPGELGMLGGGCGAWRHSPTPGGALGKGLCCPVRVLLAVIVPEVPLAGAGCARAGQDLLGRARRDRQPRPARPRLLPRCRCGAGVEHRGLFPSTVGRGRLQSPPGTCLGRAPCSWHGEKEGWSQGRRNEGHGGPS